MNNCAHCNDESQEKIRICFACMSSWREKKGRADRAADCPTHRGNCGVKIEFPILCEDCMENGFRIEREKNTNQYDPRFVLKRNNSG